MPEQINIREGWGSKGSDVPFSHSFKGTRLHYYKDGMALCGKAKDHFGIKTFEIREARKTGDCLSCKALLNMSNGISHSIYSNIFDTPEKRYRIATNVFKKFDWLVVQDIENSYLKAIKTDLTNKYKHINGTITIEYFCEATEIITQLTHPKKGLTKMMRKVTTKRMLKQIIGNPRYHSGLKATYIKP